MSLLIDSNLQDDWLQSEQSDGNFVRKDSSFAIGSQRTAQPAQPVRAGLRLNRAAIICMFHMRALGPSQPHFSIP